MDNAGLGKHCSDRIWEALQAVDDAEQDILRATVPEPVHHPEPELCAIGADAQRDMDSFVADHTFVVDIDPDRVEKTRG